MLDQIQGRIIGCLLEKQRTTPDQYPLTLNATLLACNQSSNREPVMTLEEHEVSAALAELKAAGLLRFVHPTSGRGVTKYRQVFDEHEGLEPDQSAVLAVLLLRGPQTSGELRTRCERLHSFDSVEDVERTLRSLAGGEVVRVHQLERQPGQKRSALAATRRGGGRGGRRSDPRRAQRGSRRRRVAGLDGAGTQRTPRPRRRARNPARHPRTTPHLTFGRCGIVGVRRRPNLV
ncbi:MAG: YceH family protein [Ilumatobacteraceae bacterium]